MTCHSDIFIPCIREFLRSLMGEIGVVSGEVGVSSDMIGIEDSCGLDERVVRVLRWSDRESFVDRRTRTPHSSLALHGGQLRHSAQNDDHFHLKIAFLGTSNKCAALLTPYTHPGWMHAVWFLYRYLFLINPQHNQVGPN